MPYCSTHGFQQGKHCSDCGAPLSETPSPSPAPGDSVRVRSPDAHASVNPTFVLPGGHVETRPVLVKCPKCGHRKLENETFECHGDCGRDNLCLRHFDDEYEVCVDCARTMRGDAEADAARQARMVDDLTSSQQRAEQAEAQVGELTQEGQQAQEALEKAYLDLATKQGRTHSLELELNESRDRMRQAEAQIDTLTQQGQQAHQSLEQSHSDLRQAEERVRQLAQELAAQGSRAERAEADVATLTERIQQVDISLTQRTSALSQAQERVQTLEKDLDSLSSRVERAESELAASRRGRLGARETREVAPTAFVSQETQSIPFFEDELGGTVSPELLNILVCPEDKGPLVLSSDGKWLVNLRNGYRYPIRKGIPMMLIEEGRKHQDISIGDVGFRPARSP